MLSRIRHSLRSLRLLAILEHAPKYGRQIARIAPDLFFSDAYVRLTAGSPGRVPAQNIYMTLSRMEKCGLIRRARYTPPKSLQIDAPNPGALVWYELSTLGRKTLREARESLKTYIGDPTC